MKTLRKNKIPALLVEGIEAGKKMTKKEWAQSLNTSAARVTGALSQLRKNGYNYHAHPAPIRVNGNLKTWIVLDINQKEDWLKRGLDHYEDTYTVPTMLGFFRIVESGIEIHPELAFELQGKVDELQMMMIKARQKITGEESLKIEGKK